MTAVTELFMKEKPTTSSRRGMVRLKKNFLWKGGPERSLTKTVKNTGGRNNRGVVTCQGRINPTRRKIRLVNIKRQENKIGVVDRLEYDPNRTAYIALIKNQDGTKDYILATAKMEPGMRVGSGDKADRLEGHCLKLMDIDVGSKIHNIELQPNKGGKVVRSAGTFATLVTKQSGYAEVKLPSKETRRFSLECRATIGEVSNAHKFNRKLGKASNTRFVLKRRPKVRGIAKNPVDHCNGGKSNGGGVLRNETGNVIKGKKTRKKNKFSNIFIVSRRNKGRGR